MLAILMDESPALWPEAVPASLALPKLRPEGSSSKKNRLRLSGSGQNRLNLDLENLSEITFFAEGVEQIQGSLSAATSATVGSPPGFSSRHPLRTKRLEC